MTRKLGGGVPESLWKPHQSKDVLFPRRNGIQYFFSTPQICRNSIAPNERGTNAEPTRKFQIAKMPYVSKFGDLHLIYTWTRPYAYIPQPWDTLSGRKWKIASRRTNAEPTRWEWKRSQSGPNFTIPKISINTLRNGSYACISACLSVPKRIYQPSFNFDPVFERTRCVCLANRLWGCPRWSSTHKNTRNYSAYLCLSSPENLGRFWQLSEKISQINEVGGKYFPPPPLSEERKLPL